MGLVGPRRHAGNFRLSLRFLKRNLPFHAVKLVNDAVDQVRRAESKNRPQLKYSRYLWLMNESRLSVEQSLSLEALCHMNLKTARAYRIRLAFQDIYSCPSREW